MVRRTRAELVALNETEKMWRASDGARLRFA